METVYMKKLLHRLTTELIGNCAYCTEISKEIENEFPIACTKLAGSLQPIHVNAATCLSCGAYKQHKH